MHRLNPTITFPTPFIPSTTITTRFMNYESLLEKNIVPDFLIRFGIRRMLANKLRLESEGGPKEIEKRFQTYLASLRQSPIAILTDKANEQHYELPPSFFRTVLGKQALSIILKTEALMKTRFGFSTKRISGPPVSGRPGITIFLSSISIPAGSNTTARNFPAKLIRPFMKKSLAGRLP